MGKVYGAASRRRRRARKTLSPGKSRGNARDVLDYISIVFRTMGAGGYIICLFQDVINFGAGMAGSTACFVLGIIFLIWRNRL